MDALFSKMLKAGSTTYFMDVKEAKNTKKYYPHCKSAGERRRQEIFQTQCNGLWQCGG